MLGFGKKQKTIKGKLTVRSTILLLLTIVLLVTCVSIIITKFQYNDAIRLNSELVRMIGRSFDDTLLAFKHQLDFVTMNVDFQRELKLVPPDQADGSNEHWVKLRTSTVNSILNLDRIDSIYLYSLSGQVLMKWNFKAASIAYDPFLSIFKEEKYAPDGKVTTEMVDDCLTFNRTIRDTTTLEILGYVTMLFDKNKLESQLNEISGSEGRYLAVTDNEGNFIVGSKNSDSVMKSISENKETPLSDGTFIFNKAEKMLVSKYYCSNDDWILYSIVSYDTLLTATSLVNRIIVVIGLLMVCIAFWVENQTANEIVEPIKKMLNTVHKVSEEDYSVPAIVSSNDETKILADNINIMVRKIDNLVNINLRDEIRYKDAQLIALQAQINPHFLYNMLECICCMSELGKKDEVRKVTVAFSRMMKSIMSGEKTTTLHEELEFCEEVADLYKVLIDGELEVSIEDGLNANEVFVPRLMIQPLVENAFIHGIKPLGERGVVLVSVSEDCNTLVLTISDNGVGMSQEMVTKINKYLENGDSKDGESIGFGMKNVIDRISIFYGHKAKITVTSSVNWGTTVEVVVPYE